MKRNYFLSLVIVEPYTRKAGRNSWPDSKGSPLQGSSFQYCCIKLHYYPTCRTYSKKLQLKWKSPLCSYLLWAQLPSYHLRLQTTLSAIWERKCLQSYKINFLWKNGKTKTKSKTHQGLFRPQETSEGLTRSAHNPDSAWWHCCPAILLTPENKPSTTEGYPRQQLELSAKEGLSRPHGLSKITEKSLRKASISHCTVVPPNHPHRLFAKPLSNRAYR